MKKLFKIPALLFAIMLVVSSCGNETKSDDKSNEKEQTQKPTIESDAQRVCDLNIEMDPFVRELGSGEIDNETYREKTKKFTAEIEKISSNYYSDELQIEEFSKLIFECLKLKQN
jgi:ABC-type Fe3+-citrate transport system substrate-binding protein